MLEELKVIKQYLQKNLYFIFSLYFIIEIYIYMKIGKTNIFMFSSSIFVTMFIICSIFLMTKDFDICLKIYVMVSPLLPVVLYIFFRMKMQWVGSSIYWIYFALFIVNFYKNLNLFDFSQLIYKYKRVLCVYILLSIISIISAVLSINKIESLNLAFLSGICLFFISTIILAYKRKDKKFLNHIIIYLCFGCALSSIPDVVTSIYTMIFMGKNMHLYGVLGSNFMLGYTLLVFPYILIYSINKTIVPKLKNAYLILLIIEMVNLCTQRSRGILIAVFLCYLFVIIYDKSNIKKYICSALIVFSCLLYNITHRWEFNEIKAILDTDGLDGLFEGNTLLLKMLKQFKSRRPIWIVAFLMIRSYPYFGVGPGQFKNYYLKFGGNAERMYIDAHNIFLNIATEFGMIFTLVFFGVLIIFIIRVFTFYRKNRKYGEFIVPGVIGVVIMFIYGNITGQAFMTSTYPISIVPAFVLMIIITCLMKVTYGITEE